MNQGRKQGAQSKLVTVVVIVVAVIGWWFQQQQGGGTSNSNNNSNNSNAPHATSTNTGASQHWSKTNPAINLRHVFEGEINSKGKPVGFHSRPNGQDPANAKLIRKKDKPNRAGVYTATIAVRDGSQWKEKFSSFFPDSMSQDEVTKVILAAYKNSSNNKKQPWTGPSGLGFNVQGYTSSRGGINTAFPVYRK